MRGSHNSASTRPSRVPEGRHMPTLEFFGWNSGERKIMEERLRKRLAQEDFRGDCVFVDAGGSAVRDWEGASRPFVRVSTRSAKRGERFRELLRGICDLEIVRIEFYPAADGNDQE